jgi:uncharacterized protein (TIGR02284 family)
MSHRFTIDALNELIIARNDSAQGLRICIESLSLSPFENPPLRALLLSYLEECQQAVEELQSLVRLLGGNSDRPMRHSSLAQRRWLKLRTALACNEDGVILEELERGESRTLEVYRNAMDDPLPSLVRAIVMRQFEDVMSNHDQIRSLRSDPLAQRPLAASGAGNGAQAGPL